MKTIRLDDNIRTLGMLDQETIDIATMIFKKVNEFTIRQADVVE